MGSGHRLPPSLLGSLLLFALCPASRAQDLPSTDILLLQMGSRQANAHAGKLRNLTQRDGYNNQPSFHPDGQSLLYTAVHDGQADIYRLDYVKNLLFQVTDTPESEYSPTVMPGGDGLSVVRVEGDGTQRLWAFDMEGKAPRLLLEDVQPVGYHVWVDANTVAVFILGEPSTLQLVDRRTGRAEVVARDIGRTLQRLPGKAALSFVHKEAPDRWVIKTLDPATRALTPVTETLPGREDFAWRPDGSLLMADGGVVYDWTQERGSWLMLSDLTSVGVTNITRISVSEDGAYIALVADRPDFGK